MPAYDGPERRHVEAPKYAGPERRTTPGDAAFQQAVEAASKTAAQSVARIHRVRLVTQAGLASFAAAMIVSAIVGFGYFIPVARQDSRNLAQTNCRSVTELSGTTSDFIDWDAKLRVQQQKTSVTAKILRDFGHILPRPDLAAAAKQNNDFQNAVVAHWRNVDEQRLRALAATNCTGRLR